MRKRVLACILSLLMVFSYLPTLTYAGTSSTEESNVTTTTTTNSDNVKSTTSKTESSVDEDSGNDEGTSDVGNIDKLEIKWVNKTGTTLSNYKGITNGLNTAVADYATASKYDEDSENTKGKNYTFEVNYALSGSYAHDPYTVDIRIPADIFTKRDGGNGSTITSWSLLSKEEIESGKTSDSSLCYYYDSEKNEYVITNYKQIAGGEKGSVQATVRIQTPSDIVDGIQVGGTTVDSSKYIEYANESGIISNPLNATLTVRANSGNRSTSKTSNNIYAQLDTRAVLGNVIKTGLLYYKWQSQWGTKPSEDGDDYVYVVWTFMSRVDTASQPYDLEYTDGQDQLSIKSSKGVEKDYSGELIGFAVGEQTKEFLYGSDASNAKNFTDSDGNAVMASSDDLPKVSNSTKTYENNTNYYRYKNFVLTKYKKSELENNDKLYNTVTATLNGIDDKVDQVKQASAYVTYSTPQDFVVPKGNFSISKSGTESDYTINQLAEVRMMFLQVVDG